MVGVVLRGLDGVEVQTLISHRRSFRVDGEGVTPEVPGQIYKEHRFALRGSVEWVAPDTEEARCSAARS